MVQEIVHKDNVHINVKHDIADNKLTSWEKLVIGCSLTQLKLTMASPSDPELDEMDKLKLFRTSNEQLMMTNVWS